MPSLKSSLPAFCGFTRPSCSPHAIRWWLRKEEAANAASNNFIIMIHIVKQKKVQVWHAACGSRQLASLIWSKHIKIWKESILNVSVWNCRMWQAASLVRCWNIALKIFSMFKAASGRYYDVGLLKYEKENIFYL